MKATFPITCLPLPNNPDWLTTYTRKVWFLCWTHDTVCALIPSELYWDYHAEIMSGVREGMIYNGRISAGSKWSKQADFIEHDYKKIAILRNVFYEEIFVLLKVRNEI